MKKHELDIFQHLNEIFVEQAITASFSAIADLSVQKSADMMRQLLLGVLDNALSQYELESSDHDRLLREGLEEGLRELLDVIRWVQIRAGRMEHLQFESLNGIETKDHPTFPPDKQDSR